MHASVDLVDVGSRASAATIDEDEKILMSRVALVQHYENMNYGRTKTASPQAKMSSPLPIKVLLIPFANFNTLDLNGPLDVLGNPALPEKTFEIHIAAKDDLTTAFENVIIKRHISLEQARSSLGDYDILIQPGGGPDSILPHLHPNDPWFAELLEIVAAFAKLPPSPRLDAGERVIMSICTGALLLGYAGVFDGLTATTHYLSLGQLREVCDDYVKRTPGAMGTTVVPDVPTDAIRYVDAGLNASNVRVISSGGISCGLDAALYLVAQRLGKYRAVDVAAMMEYAWRQM
jgi:transcriptional regulator GlxA family with amidase domain